MKKRNKFLAFGIILCLLFAMSALTLVTVSAEPEEEEKTVTDYLTYYVGADGVVITKCDTSISGEVEIPAQIEDTDVIEIAYDAFMGCTGITSLIIPDTVEIIGSYAFANCSYLETVVVPDSVLSIDFCAFKGCNRLTEMTIPFVGHTALDETYCYIGWLFNDVNRTGDIRYKYQDNFYLPETLKKITVTGGVAIRDNAFRICRYLETVILPDTITSIGAYAFTSVSTIKSITIPESVTRIYDHAFWESGLTSIVIPDSVIMLGDWAFAGCGSLESATLSSGMQSVNQYAFSECSKLSSVTFTDSILSIEPYAFQQCYALQNVTIPGNVTRIGDYAFYKSGINTLIIGEGTNYINRYAFNGCSSMKSIEIPCTIITVGQNAFYGCNGLNDTYYSGNEEYWSRMTIESGNEPLINAERHYGLSAPVNIELSCIASVMNGNIVLQTSINKVVSAEKLHVAIYSADNRLLNYIIVPNFGEYTVVNTVFADIPEATYAKAFLWEDVKALQPLSRAVNVDIVR